MVLCPHCHTFATQARCNQFMGASNRHLFSRRKVLSLLGVAGAALGSGCASPTTASSVTSGAADTTAGAAPTTSSGSATTAGVCLTSPEETTGPYPDKVGMINNTAF